MSGGRRMLVWIVLSVLVVGLVAYGFVPRAPEVEGTSVARAPLQVVVREEGKTRVVDRFVVSAPVAGYAERIELEVGQQVRRGQALVYLQPLRSEVLDPRRQAEAEAAVRSAEANLRAARNDARAAAADARYAALELGRLSKLFEQRTIARGSLDQAETQEQRTRETQASALARVDMAQGQLEAARTALKYSGAGANNSTPARFAVTSSIEGRVLRVVHESEGPVTVGETLLELGDPSRLEVEVDVLSADAVRISPGTRVLFERWGGDDELEGRVKRIEPVGFTKVSALGVEEQRVWVIADITSPPEQWQRLGDGYRVEARFIVWDSEGVLQIPASALFRRGDDWAVFTVNDGRTSLRTIEVGHRGIEAVEVLSGLEADDVIVLHPGHSLMEGARVRLRS